MNKLYEKLNKARKLVRETPHKKEGSGYAFKYFTPEQVELIVVEACEEVKMLPVCSLKRDEHGLYQELKLIDLEEDSEPLVFTLATSKGDLKNTNDTQNMGSTDTYSERYIKMKVFQIKDNNLDPDSQDHTKSKGSAVVDDLDL